MALLLGPLASCLLAVVLGLPSRPAATPLLSAQEPENSWTSVDFRTATCGYAAADSLTFSLPPGYVVRDPHHGGETGCLWGTAPDLDRALSSKRSVSFERLDHGVFQARLTPNMAYEGSGRFSGESELPAVLADAGMSDVRVARRSFPGHSGLVVTGRRADGLELYMLYLAREAGANVVLINYRTATPPTASDSENWRRFLSEIR
ncbi:MAG TPA: hypothetical protein VKG01_18990 [Thermoanaerobaculia bacterium]|nr:hypothetical protein [Thermoanaerobaculia bacterium]